MQSNRSLIACATLITLFLATGCSTATSPGDDATEAAAEQRSGCEPSSGGTSSAWQIVGNVRHEDSPIEAVGVTITDDDQFSATVCTNADGQYSVAVPSGDVRYEVSIVPETMPQELQPAPEALAKVAEFGVLQRVVVNFLLDGGSSAQGDVEPPDRVAVGQVTAPRQVGDFVLLTDDDVNRIQNRGDYTCDDPVIASRGPDESYGSIWTEIFYYTNNARQLEDAETCADATATLLSVIVSGFPDQASATEKYELWFLSSADEYLPNVRCAKVANLLCGGASDSSNWAVFWLVGGSGEESDLPALAELAAQIIP